jgi:hypothetical protein
MTEQAATLTRYDLEAKIVRRCWQDDAFYREFTADPVGTAVKYLEVPAADLPHIVVHEEPAGSWHIVLPARPANVGELSDEDLEKVAGGYSMIVPVLLTAIGISVTVASGISASAAATVYKGW